MDSVGGVYAGFTVLILHSDKRAHAQLPLSARADIWMLAPCIHKKLFTRQVRWFFCIILFELDYKKNVFEKVN